MRHPTDHPLPLLLLLLPVLVSVSACATELSLDETCDEACDSLAPAARCTASVDWSGSVNVESDYLPGVLACENPKGNLQSLKAQAIASRSYLYYHLDRSGSIGDGEGAQVYSCGKTPTDLHRQAVNETAGQVLRYRNTQVAAFYVQGAVPIAQTCRGGTEDANDTEKHVTYNQGLSGASVHQTSQGKQDPSNYANRGSMSQLGANCLGNYGTSDQILRYYYGQDIEIVQAVGTCTAGSSTSGTSNTAGAWIGTDCRGSSTICDFQAGASMASCMRWRTSPGQPAYCSAACYGSCPTAAGKETAFCASLGGAHGFCTTRPSEANGWCNSTGTIPKMASQFGNPSVVDTVCLP